jgi:hypothetical protein
MRMIRHQGEVYVEAASAPGSHFPHHMPPSQDEVRDNPPHKKCPKGQVWSLKQKKCIKLTSEQIRKRQQYLKAHPRKK